MNMLHLVPRETGGSELYARRLVPALLEASPGIELTLFAAREGAPSLAAEPWAGELRIVELPVWARSRPRRVLVEQTLLPLAVRRANLDLLHNVFTTSPAVSPVPMVTTILDVIYKRVPETHPGAFSSGMALLASVSALRSERILTLSEAAQADIVDFLHVDRDKVDVAYLGPGMPDDVEPVPESALRERFRLGGSTLLLAVSAKRAHKNLERLIDAVVELSRRSDVVLVIPGYVTELEARLRERAHGADSVRFTGWLDDSTLEGLYRAADCFVFPSLAEGFGLPVLEAMLRGTPVACSSATSLPEVGGDAVVYFDPLDTREIMRAIERVLGDAELRDRLRERGYAQARKFSWRETAARTARSYELALADGRQPAGGARR
jgi:glycosyltransferase involved in cell wall biosynthesis